MEDSIDNESFDTIAFAQSLAAAAAEMQASDIVILDLRGRVAYTDGFVLCSGRNRRHVIAIADAVKQHVKKTYGKLPNGMEGQERGQWVLVDFGDFVVHVFDREMRGYYDLDGLWSDAPRIDGPEPEPSDDDDTSEPRYFS